MTPTDKIEALAALLEGNKLAEQNRRFIAHLVSRVARGQTDGFTWLQLERLETIHTQHFGAGTGAA
jgi:hypothetical protein